MNNFRLHIDIPLTDNLTDSETISKKVIEFLTSLNVEGVNVLQYKLSNDSDRANKNYLDINENGHASNKKCKIEFN